MADDLAKVRWDGPGVDAWQPWSPSEIAERLAGLDAGWCVVGGWSIDLFLGKPTRHHEDLEIATQRASLPAIRERLADYVFHAAGSGSIRRLQPGEQGPPEWHQHWVLDVGAQAWRVDVMIEPGDEDTWAYRRDPRLSAARASMIGETAEGIPFLLPHGTLLYKAKAVRPKDQADFHAVIGSMTESSKSWLRRALELMHPGHPWIEAL